MKFKITTYYVAPGGTNEHGWTWQVANRLGESLQQQYGYASRVAARAAAETWADHKAKACQASETYDYTPKVEDS